MSHDRRGPSPIFRLLDKIGDVGKGVVYKSRDTYLDRFVTIKASMQWDWPTWYRDSLTMSANPSAPDKPANC